MVLVDGDYPGHGPSVTLKAAMMILSPGMKWRAAASTLGISRKGLYLKRLRLGITDFAERAH